MKSKSLCQLLLLASLAVACSEQKKFNDMRDATVEMKDTTEEMNKKTENLNKTTERMEKRTEEVVEHTSEMNKRTETLVGMTEKLEDTSGKLKSMTDELYDALRQGNALQLRREAYDALVKAPTMFKKISEAGKYFMSFEVQLWNQFGQDGTENKRDELAQQAAQEFFMEIEGLAPRDGSVDPTAAPDAQMINSAKNREASFNALAMTLHQMNRKQSPAIAGRNLKAISMLSLMEEALLTKDSPEKEDSGPSKAFVREILAHEPKAIQLLQARYNMFPAAFVDFITQINDKNIVKQAWMTYIAGWELDLTKLNAKQLDFIQNDVLTQAIHARELMKQIGVKPQMNSKVARLLKNVKIKDAGTGGAVLVAEQTKMLGLLQNLQSEL